MVRQSPSCYAWSIPEAATVPPDQPKSHRAHFTDLHQQQGCDRCWGKKDPIRPEPPPQTQLRRRYQACHLSSCGLVAPPGRSVATKKLDQRWSSIQAAGSRSLLVAAATAPACSHPAGEPRDPLVATLRLARFLASRLPEAPSLPRGRFAPGLGVVPQARNALPQRPADRSGSSWTKHDAARRASTRRTGETR